MAQYYEWGVFGSRKEAEEFTQIPMLLEKRIEPLITGKLLGHVHLRGSWIPAQFEAFADGSYSARVLDTQMARKYGLVGFEFMNLSPDTKVEDIDSNFERPTLLKERREKRFLGEVEIMGVWIPAQVEETFDGSYFAVILDSVEGRKYELAGSEWYDLTRDQVRERAYPIDPKKNKRLLKDLDELESERLQSVSLDVMNNHKLKDIPRIEIPEENENRYTCLFNCGGGRRKYRVSEQSHGSNGSGSMAQPPLIKPNGEVYHQGVWIPAIVKIKPNSKKADATMVLNSPSGSRIVNLQDVPTDNILLGDQRSQPRKPQPFYQAIFGILSGSGF